MKRFLCFVFSLSLLFSLYSCGNKNIAQDSKQEAVKDEALSGDNVDRLPVTETTAPINDVPTESDTQKTQNNADSSALPKPSAPPSTPEPTEEPIDNPAWDELNNLGRIETENGLLYVKITVPADYVSSDTTQDRLDENAGETYSSAILNADGSVTYKMTKKQHKAMLDSVSAKIDDLLQEWIDSPDYSFTEITHDSDYSSFEVHLSTEQLGLSDSLMVVGFYMLGGMYSSIAGQKAENIEVKFYSASNVLINTANSSSMQG